MTSKGFRRIAIGMKDAIESAHMGHPDFRVHNRIFATLHADLKYGMVKLTPEQQARFIADEWNHFGGDQASQIKDGVWNKVA